MKKLLTIAFLLPLLQSTVLAGTDLVISWTPNPAAESNQLYRVYMSTNPLTVFGLAGLTTSPTLTISNVPAGTYGISVSASNIWKESQGSAPVYAFISVPSIVSTMPTGVGIFIRSSPSGSDLIVNWNPNPPAESNLLYRVYLSTNSTTAFTLAGAVPGSSFILSNIAPATYGASVTASNLAGIESPKSPGVYTVGPIIVPTVPAGVTIFIRTTP